MGKVDESPMKKRRENKRMGSPLRGSRGKTNGWVRACGAHGGEQTDWVVPASPAEKGLGEGAKE